MARFTGACVLGGAMALLLSVSAAQAQQGEEITAGAPRTMSEVLEASGPNDWRRLDPERTLYVELASGRVVIELAPEFAPRHVENIKALAREGFYDGLPILRAQDNFVVQWGEPGEPRPIRTAKRTLAPEFTRPAQGLAFTALPDPDTYAPEAGFAYGFAAARDRSTNSAWMVHCYATVGVGRDNDVNSAGGAELYVVIGHSPRQLDRNITLVGRVVQGMELLSTLPRGSGALGFYEKPEQYVPIRAVRVAADAPQAQRTELEILRTDTQTFADLVEARRNRRDDWYKVPAGRIDVCNVPLVTREIAAKQR